MVGCTKEGSEAGGFRWTDGTPWVYEPIWRYEGRSEKKEDLFCFLQREFPIDPNDFIWSYLDAAEIHLPERHLMPVACGPRVPEFCA